LRVLVASEDRSERDLIRGALSAQDRVTEVACLSDGVEAYLAVRDSLPDVVVASADLPRMDGIVLARTIARSPHLRGARTLLVLGVSCIHRVREALEARPTALIVRPFDGNVFVARFVEALDAPLESALDGASEADFAFRSDLPLTAEKGNVRTGSHDGMGPEAAAAPAGRSDRRRSPWQALKARITGRRL
jgi:DNA-binding NarL/FixJ family response regulator